MSSAFLYADVCCMLDVRGQMAQPSLYMQGNVD